MFPAGRPGFVQVGLPGPHQRRCHRGKVRRSADARKIRPVTVEVEGALVMPFSSIRRRIAQHMVQSVATSPHVSMGIEVDFAKIAAMRSQLQHDWRAREGFALSYLPFVAWAVCRAIADYPLVNASVDGETLIVSAEVGLGFAVDLDFQGLVVPVIPSADQLTIAELARRIHRLSEAARTRHLSPDDVGGGSYTISNIGSAGTLFTTHIINQPQVAILSVDGIRRKPVVDPEADDQIAIHPVGVLVQ